MRAVVCGAGIAGLTLAQRLAAQGWTVTLVERAPAPRQQGYMIDFFGPGYDAAELIGVLPRLQELAYPIQELVYVDRGGRASARTDYARFAPAVSGRLLSILRPDLEAALRELVPAEVDVRFDCSVAAIEDLPDGVRVELTDGETIEADLLVGADGIHSAVRRLLFGEEEQFLRYLGLHTAAYTFTDPTVHAALGDTLYLTDTVDRMFGLYALRDGRVAAFAVHRSPGRARPDDVRRALRETYRSMDWLVVPALARCPAGAEVYYDEVSQVQVPQWSRGRVVLVGDACHAVSLLAGQGASLAMAGSCLLAEQLRTAPSVSEALASYQRLWQPVVVARQRSGRAGIDWFLPSSSARLVARRAMLRLMALPLLDRWTAGAFLGKHRVRLGDLLASARPGSAR